MIRHLFTALSAVSLVLCVVSLALWVVTLRNDIWIYRITNKTTTSALAHSSVIEIGRIVLFGESHNGHSPGSAFGNGWRVGPRGTTATFQFNHPGASRLGFRLGGFWCAAVDERGAWSPQPFGRARVLVIPCWIPSLLFAVAPLGSGIRLHRLRRRRQRAARCLCASCGYDLRASTDRCPECGTPIPVEATA